MAEHPVRLQTMLRLNERQREILIDALPDTANLALGGMLFGRAILGARFSWEWAVGGALTWLVLMAFSLVLARNRP